MQTHPQIHIRGSNGVWPAHPGNVEQDAIVTCLELRRGRVFCRPNASAEGLGLMSVLKDFRYVVKEGCPETHRQPWAVYIDEAWAGHAILIPVCYGYAKRRQIRGHHAERGCSNKSLHPGTTLSFLSVPLLKPMLPLVLGRSNKTSPI